MSSKKWPNDQKKCENCGSTPVMAYEDALDGKWHWFCALCLFDVDKLEPDPDAPCWMMG